MMADSVPDRNTQPGDEVDLARFFGQIWGDKYLILLTTLIALVLGVIFVLGSTRIYQAQSLMQIEARSANLALPESLQDMMGGAGGGGSSSATVETESEIIRSHMVLGVAVREMNLQIRATPRTLPLISGLFARLGIVGPDIGFLRPFGRGDARILVGEMTVPDHWLNEAFTLTALGTGRYLLQTPEGAEHEGEIRKALSLPGFRLVVDELSATQGRQFSLMRTTDQRAVEDLRKTFSVSAASRNSTMLRLTLEGPDPRMAEKVLDSIARAYVTQNLSRSAAEAENSLKFIEEQLPEAEQTVMDAQQALNNYQQQQHSVDVNFETRSLLERAAELEAELSKLSIQEEEIRKRYTVNHRAYQLLLESRSELERQLDSIRKDTASLPETQKEIFNLTRDLEVAQQSYIQLLSRGQELRVLRASTVGSVRVIDEGYSNGLKIRPRTTSVLGMALVAGALIGTGLGFLRRLVQRGVVGAEEIERVGLPVFGTVNFTGSAANHRRNKGVMPILAITQPEEIAVEALRSLRTALYFGMLDAATKSIQMTSAAPGAGKSFTSVNLAVVAAQAGQKVCLIDADLRRGYMRRYFGLVDKVPGLSEYLSHSHSLEQVLRKGPVEGLDFIASGHFPPNPSELLMRQDFQDLLSHLDKSYDLIVVDSPPTLAVTDPVVIGRYVGATLVVVRHLETSISEVEAVMQTFRMSGAKITGAVMNGYRPELDARHGGYQRSYRYSYKSEEK